MRGDAEGEVFPIGAAVSSDGRYVAFVSAADNLVEGDANNAADVFLRDTQSGATTLVSVRAGGGGTGNAASGVSTLERRTGPVISADGRFVAYVSNAADLVADDGNDSPDIFLFDRTAGTNALVTANAGNTASAGANDTSNGSPSISDDGRYVAFASTADDLIDYGGGAPDPDGNLSDVFVRDTQSNTTEVVSVSAAGLGTADAGEASSPSISNDGRYIAFVSSSADLVAGVTGTARNVYVRDTQTDATALASVAAGGSGGGAGGENPDSTGPALSGDGRSVAFLSRATNLVGGFVDANGEEDDDVFVRDLDANATELASASTAAGGATGSDGPSFAPSISDNGQFVAFSSNAQNLVAIDNGTANAGPDVFLRDVEANVTTLLSANAAGTAPGNAPSGDESPPAMSADGRHVAFVSLASDLAPAGAGTDGNAAFDVYVRDRQANATRLLSADAAGAATGGASTVSLSANGGQSVFTSDAANLIEGDANAAIDVFAATTAGGSGGTGGDGPDLTGTISGSPPAAVVAGARARTSVTVRVTNAGNATFRGPVTVTAYASRDHTVDGGDAELRAVTRRLNLRAGRSASVRIPITAFPDVPNNEYDIIAQITPGEGAPAETNAGNNTAAADVHVTIAQPFTELAAVEFAAVPRGTVRVGGSTSATLAVRNAGNVPVNGTINVALAASTAATGANPTALATVPVNLKMKAGATKRLRLRFAVPAELQPGTYFLAGTIDGSAVTDANAANNAAVSTGTFTV